MIGSTSFDGASNGTIWNDLAPHLQTFSSTPSASIASPDWSWRSRSACCSWSDSSPASTASGWPGCGSSTRNAVPASWRCASRSRWCRSRRPYVIAHYFSLIVYQGQAVPALASDPLGDGSDIFVVGNISIDYSVVSASGIWYVQVGQWPAWAITIIPASPPRGSTGPGR